MRHILSDATVDKFVQYGVNVWKLDANLDKFEIANTAIDKTEEYFRSIGMPTTLRELGIENKDLFKPNYEYRIRIGLYGPEELTMDAILTGWSAGGEIHQDMDDVFEF